MSVLIKGMKMPDNCWECRFNASTIDRSDVCVITNKTYNWGLPHPPSDCPITELPPHGRLIDADALFFTDLTLAQIALEKGNPFKNLAIAIFEKIESAPTILEAEVEE